MKVQNSFQEDTENGTLYMVPTPIGNLEDITFRALNILKAVDRIAAEDTRNTKKLMNHFEINKPLISYHEHNKQVREELMLTFLEKGENVALVSDAGMPAISDPGNDIVQAAIEHDYKVVVLPGANAALCALVGSGLATDQFLFYGFLPRKKKDRNDELNKLKTVRATILFYESPHRLKDTLSAIQKELGERNITIARELTKRYEEYIRGSVSEVISWAETGMIKGEFCLVVEGNNLEHIEDTKDWWTDFTIEEHVNHYIEEGLRSKDAIKKTSEDRKVPKREIYQAFHVE